MAGELIYEMWCGGANTDATIELPGDPPVTATAQPWLRWSLTDSERPPRRPTGVELGLAHPRPDRPTVGPKRALRCWRRDAGTGDDAQIVLAWLRGNALAERSGIDTDMLVQLFIEAALTSRDGLTACDGEYLSTITGTAHPVGASADWQWSLQANLPAALVAAALEAIAGSGPRWRYAIVAAEDPDSPAGRVRRRLLDDLGR